MTLFDTVDDLAKLAILPEQFPSSLYWPTCICIGDLFPPVQAIPTRRVTFLDPDTIAMSISKVAASLVTAHNENTLALANINFDFSLIKVEPPKEFSSLGNALSKVRRGEAEDGLHHRTARNLGALFQSIIPPTPELFKAYGRRVCEIAESENFNPRGSAMDGLFANRIGIDATSIWAAATSGSSALAVHLLACILARTFTGPEATSAWVEIVEQRKAEIQRASEAGEVDQFTRFMAAPQQLSRSQLADWDASARAWLQSADEAKSEQQMRLLTALNKVHIPVMNEATVLQSIVRTWTAALKAMECLVKGTAQRIQDASVLLGLSSWHLYPDILVLGDSAKVVKQHDMLISTGGLLTLGLHIDTESEESIFWTLPLAYLRYYGDPVMSRGSVGPDNTRISVEDLSIVMLGCILRDWVELGHDALAAVSWFPLLHQLFQECYAKDGSKYKSEGEKLALFWAVESSSWLTILANAATTLIDSQDGERERLLRLLGLGRRRASFLGPSGDRIMPFFGLKDPSCAMPILIDAEMRVAYLRKLALDANLKSQPCIIRYRPSKVTDHPIWVYASVFPRLLDSMPRKRASNGGLKEGTNVGHVRWIPLTGQSGVTLMLDEYVKTLNEVCFPCPDVYLEDALGLSEAAAVHIGDLSTAAIFLLDRDLPLGKKHELRGLQSSIKQQYPVALKESPVLPHPHTRVEFSSEDVRSFLRRGVTNISQLIGLISGKVAGQIAKMFATSLGAFASLVSIYKLLPGATISTSITLKTIGCSKWAEGRWYRDTKNPVVYGPIRWSAHLNRTEVFACIAHCESGSCDLDPESLNEVFALSVGNSIYVSGSLLCDPAESTATYEVRRLIGNIGRAGIALLIAPQEPRIRKSSESDWTVINHAPFDGEIQDSFQHTSVHLSFTEYTMPLSVTAHGNIDSTAFLIESLVSVHDRGKWVADIDILAMFDDLNFRKCHETCETCNHSPQDPPLGLTIVDTWEELLERPDGDLIVRAHRNWVARLALAAFCTRRGDFTIALQKQVCWQCCKAAYPDALQRGYTSKTKDKDHQLGRLDCELGDDCRIALIC